MMTLVLVLILGAPIAGLVALLVLVDRRAAWRRAEILRQIALTDALHARLGAVVAPVVCWRRRAWQVAVAVPFEQPAVVAAVLTTVTEMFGPVRYEVVLRRQAPAAPLRCASQSARLAQESLSWT